MKHLYLTFLFIALCFLIIGFAVGMIIQNILTVLWFNFGRLENAAMILWLPFFVLAMWQFSKFKKWLNPIMEANQIKSIGKNLPFKSD